MRVILVDDEPPAREGMRTLLTEHADVEIVGEAENVARAAELIRITRPDAVFLDIHMPGADGFQLLGAHTQTPKVVFVTAYSNHAVQAFEVDAVDYLLKPVRPRRLADALRRVRAALGELGDTEPGSVLDTGECLCLRTPERTVVIKVAHVIALEAERDFTRVHSLGREPVLIGMSLGEYERLLPHPPFKRISRSLMVNLSVVESVTTKSRDFAALKLRGVDGEFELHRRARGRLLKAIGLPPEQCV